MKIWVIENSIMRCVNTGDLRVFIDNRSNLLLEDKQGSGTGYKAGDWFDKEDQARSAFLELKIKTISYHCEEITKANSVVFPGEATCLTSAT